MRIYETSARYFLAAWFLICVADGWALLIFDIHFFKLSPGSFYGFLERTTWFWLFLKIVQTVGTASLLFNYKPALGLALITPISAVLCLYYVIKLPLLSPFPIIAVMIAVSTIVLLRAYSKSFMPLLADYNRSAEEKPQALVKQSAM